KTETSWPCRSPVCSYAGHGGRNLLEVWKSICARAGSGPVYGHLDGNSNERHHREWKRYGYVRQRYQNVEQTDSFRSLELYVRRRQIQRKRSCDWWMGTGYQRFCSALFSVARAVPGRERRRWRTLAVGERHVHAKPDVWFLRHCRGMSGGVDRSDSEVS